MALKNIQHAWVPGKNFLMAIFGISVSTKNAQQQNLHEIGHWKLE